MKKLLCLGFALTIISGCSTLPSRVETAANSYTAPAHLEKSMASSRPRVQEWCDNYSKDDSGSHTYCILVQNTLVFRFDLKPGWEISPDMQAKVSQKMRSSACNGSGVFNRRLKEGYAIVPFIEKSHDLDVITLESCNS